MSHQGGEPRLEMIVRKAAAVGVVLGLLASLEVGAGAAVFSHEAWSGVLSRFVDERGLVDYRGLTQERYLLERYVEQIERTSPRSDPGAFPTRDHELAYYINAYNALVFDGVLARGPEEESVWSGGLISGYAFFVAMKVVVGGQETSLRRLENQVIREEYRDPRIHAALNCASLGCPRLPREVFAPETLDAQLDAAMRELVADERHVRVREADRSVELSKIFDWFTGDFIQQEKSRGTQSPGLLDYVNRYRAEGAQIPRDYAITFLPYDKAINKQP